LIENATSENSKKRIREHGGERVMSNSRYDVAVAYRVHPQKSGNPPPVYAEDKFKLAELCLKSLKASLGGLKVKLWALLNECPPEFEELFQQVWPAEDLVLLRYKGIGPGATLHEQSRLLLEQTDAELVYFAEDDYFFLPGQFPLLVDFLRQNPNADFTTPYEHPDQTTTDLHKHRRKTLTFGGREWNLCMSTTHSFLAKKSALIELQWIFDKMFAAFGGRTSPDLGMWMAITKIGLYNPWQVIRWMAPHRHWAGSILYAWFYCWRQILFGRRYTLWTPRPPIATHMVARQLSPGVDWHQEFKTRINSEP
jgi:hypothetical protein